AAHFFFMDRGFRRDDRPVVVREGGPSVLQEEGREILMRADAGAGKDAVHGISERKNIRERKHGSSAFAEDDRGGAKDDGRERRMTEGKKRGIFNYQFP